MTKKLRTFEEFKGVDQEEIQKLIDDKKNSPKAKKKADAMVDILDTLDQIEQDIENDLENAG